MTNAEFEARVRKLTGKAMVVLTLAMVVVSIAFMAEAFGWQGTIGVIGFVAGYTMAWKK